MKAAKPITQQTNRQGIHVAIVDFKNPCYILGRHKEEHMHIETMLALVAEKWPCTEKEYPEMAVLNEAGRKRLERNHTLFHVMKSTGRLATHLEAHDHGAHPNMVASKKEIGKLLLDVMRLAVAFNMTPQELEQFISEWEQQRR